MNNGNSFSYTYSAKDTSEIKKIRDKYAPPEEDKLTLLKKLDKSVCTKARAWSLTLGILGTLVMGAGMSLCMPAPTQYFVSGIALGLCGMAALSAAYPTYSLILKRERKKIAPMIIALSDELMK